MTAGWARPLIAALALLAPALQALPGGAQPTVFYVSLNGSDTNQGSIDLPWRTIQHAADTLQAGQTAFVRGGVYFESVILSRSGEPGRPITFAAKPGENVVLDGENVLAAGFSSDFSDPDPRVSDIVIDGFAIRRFRQNGIAAWSMNDRIALQNLTISDNGDFAVLLSNSDGSRIENVVMRNNRGGFSCSPILPPSGPGCTNLRITRSSAIDNGTGDDTGYDAFAVEKGTDILVENSLASGGPGDGFDFKSDRTLLSGVVASNTRNNIKLWGRDSALTNSLAFDARADANLVLAAGGSYTVTNVTIANMTATAYLVVVGDTSGTSQTPVRIRNSIFSNDNPANQGTLLWLGPSVQLLSLEATLLFNPFRADDAVCLDYPPYQGRCFGSDTLGSGSPFGSELFWADPAFVDGKKKDFHLRPTSPAVDGGSVSAAPVTDLDGRRRDAKPDIGAYEMNDRVLFVPRTGRRFMPASASQGQFAWVPCLASRSCRAI